MRDWVCVCVNKPANGSRDVDADMNLDRCVIGTKMQVECIDMTAYSVSSTGRVH